MKRRKKIWEKVNLSEYTNSEEKESNEIETSEIEKCDAPKITIEDIFPFEEIDKFIKELDEDIDDWSLGESEEEKIMRAIENGYGDMYGFD
jgi:hypothetical protein